ncbi:hypothetical protein NG800_002635 [Epilithonimonas ginsengisoli]|uniref:OmpH family outer membrane protein n=1 Tax=Epilithonimonas ginsengisoli TaxID=1245592 RepID=A0ABU4JDQ7_9FLAO|nr:MULTISPECIES: hypothetical protein [Chryseobacterium group]MBV6878944.1 hypothetical protein [Epilithonimonas sp. FP105]MDW8547791.1 hypothetical protein [Epilithonimonas ginsengisoli]OAH76044.1 hypothetical protein AXA65_01980 [Chryseobacterium sp. FP211-J200]
MALENLISVEFTNAELAQLDTAFGTIETVLQGKTINLTPEQRQQYGSIAEQNKLFVNKAKSYMEQYPQYVPPFLDKPEYDKDFAARQQLESRMQKMNSLTEQLSDTKILLDFDNYHNSLTFYRNVKYLSSENVPGTNVIYNDMKQFFIAPTSTIPGDSEK